jgi:hypothetical protein
MNARIRAPAELLCCVLTRIRVEGAIGTILAEQRASLTTMSQKKQPERQTETIATEMRPKEGADAKKPAVIENPDSELQMTSKRTLENQKAALEEKRTLEDQKPVQE